MTAKQVTNRRNPSQARSKERVDVLLNAVKALIEEIGIANIKISDIATKAKVSPSSIYQYFSDKESIILALAEDYMEIIHDIIDRNLAELKSVDDLEKVLSTNFDDIYRLHQEESAIRQIWFESIDPELNKLAIKDNELNTQKIFDAVTKFIEPKDPQKLKYFILISSYQFGNVMRLCFSSDENAYEEFKHIYIRMIANSVHEFIH